MKSSGSTCFVGTRGFFSVCVFRALIDQGVAITRVICAGVEPAPIPESTMKVLSPLQEETIEALARKLHIPLHYIINPADFEPLLSAPLEKPDFILVACFPFRLPTAVTCWPKSGCLNIHPSLLPRYRGPDPVFWQLKYNETQTGVSLHLMTPIIDAGPVVAQTPVHFLDGASRVEIEHTLADAGAKMFTDHLAVFSSTKKPVAENSSLQNASETSYHPAPCEKDYALSQNWGARHVFNFIRGACHFTRQYPLTQGGNIFFIEEAIEYNNEGRLGAAYQAENNELLIQFSPGILRAKGLISKL